MRRILDRLSDAHRSFFGDDAVEAAVVDRKFLRDEGVGTRCVLRRVCRTVGRRDGVEVIRGQEVRCVCGRNKAPQVQAVCTAVLREGLIRGSLLQLDGVVNVGVLVDVTLGSRPIDGRSALVRCRNLIEGLLSTLVVVLTVQVVVAITLAHVLDAVVASRLRLRLVDVTLRGIGRIGQFRLVGCTDKHLLPGCRIGYPLRRAVVDTLVHDCVAQELNTRGGERRFCRRLTVDADVGAAGARPSNTGVLDVGTTLAVHDRRGEGVERLVIDEGIRLGLRTGEVRDRQLQGRVQILLNICSALDRQVVVADRAEQEGLARLNGTRIVWLETDGALAVHPDLVIAAVFPQVVVLLHPVLGSLCVTGTCVVLLVIPLPRGAAGDVRPQVLLLGNSPTQEGADRLAVRNRFAAINTGAGKGCWRHARHDAVADEVVGEAGGCVGLRGVDDARAHVGTNSADVDTGGCGLLRRIGSLRSNDLASNQCTTRGRGNG